MSKRIDTRGRVCPVPLLLVQRSIKGVAPGDEIEVSSDDRAFGDDIRAWCLYSKNTLVEVQHFDSFAIARIRRGL